MYCFSLVFGSKLKEETLLSGKSILYYFLRELFLKLEAFEKSSTTYVGMTLLVLDSSRMDLISDYLRILTYDLFSESVTAGGGVTYLLSASELLEISLMMEGSSPWLIDCFKKVKVSTL